MVPIKKMKNKTECRGKEVCVSAEFIVLSIGKEVSILMLCIPQHTSVFLLVKKI